jgi:hypothetical protein
MTDHQVFETKNTTEIPCFGDAKHATYYAQDHWQGTKPQVQLGLKFILLTI